LRDAREGAVFKASNFILEATQFFRSLKGDYEAYKRLFEGLGVSFILKSWEATFNPSIINGGVKRNVVAQKCKLSADVRFAPWLGLEDILSFFSREELKLTVCGFLPSYGILADSVPLEKDLKLFSLISEAIKAEGLKPRAVFTLGVGDTRHVRKFGVPAFYFGPGGGEMHSEDEFVHISELKMAKRIYRRIVENFRMF